MLFTGSAKALFATLYAVAASEFVLTGSPYDPIMLESCEKLACKRCTYWRRRARHYSVAVMTRVEAESECAGHWPGTLTAPAR